MEQLDIYDGYRNKTGKIVERRYPMKLNINEYYLCVRCWIINENNEILLIKRNMNKIHGGMWENIGGCVKSGETSKEAIKREINEEIGINIDIKKLQLLKTQKETELFKDIYYIKMLIDKKKINIKQDEVEDFKFLKLKELKMFVRDNKIDVWTISSLDELYNVLKEMGEKEINEKIFN